MHKRGDKKKFKEFVRAIKKNPLQYYYIHTNLKKLASEGVDMNTQLTANQTLLHLAIKLNNIRLLRMFVKVGVNTNLANEAGLTPLHMAVLVSRLDYVKILVQAGCDCNLGAEMEQTPLHLAVCNGKHDIAKYLLDHGADIKALDEVNNAPIDYAIDEKDLKMIRLLLQYQEVDDERQEKIAFIERSNSHVLHR